MEIEVRIDSACTEPHIVVVTDRMTEEVAALVKRLGEDQVRYLPGWRAGAVMLLEQSDIIRAYAAAGRIMAVTAAGEFQLRWRLYELDDILDRERFVRISNAEIINLRKVRSFDMSMTGTIKVTLLDGTYTYVSRRYIARIRKVLGL